MIFSSFASLEVNEYGLDYSYISKKVLLIIIIIITLTFHPSLVKISRKPLSGGIHFLGVGHSFIKYPKTVLNLDYSTQLGADYPPLKSRTSDGLEVILEISFQYKYTLFVIGSRLIKYFKQNKNRLTYEDLYELFNLHKDNYKYIFSNIAVNTLTETVRFPSTLN